MSVKIQVVLDEEYAGSFKKQAMKESKSLSGWLREAGKKMLADQRSHRRLSNLKNLSEFFSAINKSRKGVEPGWEEHKRLILDGYSSVKGK
jgi:hypothetical protein